MSKILVKLEWMDHTSINVCTEKEFTKFEDLVDNKLQYPFETCYGNIYYCFDNPRELYDSLELTEITDLECETFNKLVGTYGIGLDIVENILDYDYD